MRTRDIKLNRQVVFNKTYLKTETINPAYASHVFKIVETVNLPTGVLVHIRAVNFPKVALWVSSAHVESFQTVNKVPSPVLPKSDQVSNPLPTVVEDTSEIQKGDIVIFNLKFKKELNYRFKVFENYEHVLENTHLVLNTMKCHPESWRYREEPAIKINCWWLPASWFNVVAKGEAK